MRAGNWQAREFVQRASAHEHVARRAIKPRAFAFRARAVALELGQLLADHAGVGFAIAPFHVGQHALERMLARVAAPAGA